MASDWHPEGLDEWLRKALVAAARLAVSGVRVPAATPWQLAQGDCSISFCPTPRTCGVTTCRSVEDGSRYHEISFCFSFLIKASDDYFGPADQVPESLDRRTVHASYRPSRRSQRSNLTVRMARYATGAFSNRHESRQWRDCLLCASGKRGLPQITRMSMPRWHLNWRGFRSCGQALDA